MKKGKQINDYNYDLVLKNGKWHIYTGDYYNDCKNIFFKDDKVKLLKKNTAMHIGAFAYDKFNDAKRYCFEHCGPVCQ